MSKNCMQCANREVACAPNKQCEYNRCALNREMRVNARMCCEEWTERIKTDFATNGITREKPY